MPLFDFTKFFFKKFSYVYSKSAKKLEMTKRAISDLHFWIFNLDRYTTQVVEVHRRLKKFRFHLYV